jgi:hypothetical protein
MFLGMLVLNYVLYGAHLSLFLGFSAFEKKCFKYVNVELKWCDLSPLKVK